MSSLVKELRKRVAHLNVCCVSGGGILTECADELESQQRVIRAARDAIDLQLRRWRDGDEICAVAELQNARNSCQELIGKAEEQVNEILLRR